jgi:hypothetical protein
MTPSLAHSTPFRSRRSLAKVSTNSREAQVLYDSNEVELPRSRLWAGRSGSDIGATEPFAKDRRRSVIHLTSDVVCRPGKQARCAHKRTCFLVNRTMDPRNHRWRPKPLPWRVAPTPSHQGASAAATSHSTRTGSTPTPKLADARRQ